LPGPVFDYSFRDKGNLSAKADRFLVGLAASLQKNDIDKPATVIMISKQTATVSTRISVLRPDS